MTEELKIRLTPFDNKLLHTMAETLGVSRAAVVRMALRQLKITLQKNGWTLNVDEHATPNTGRKRNQK